MQMDPRNKKLAKVLIEHSLKVKKGDKVVISTSDLSTGDLMNECMKLSLQKGAQVYIDVMGWNLFLDRTSACDTAREYLENASISQIKNPPEIYKNIVDWGNKFVRITTIENYSHLHGVRKDKLNARKAARREWFDILVDKKDWVLTYYPTNAMAQMAGLSTKELHDFYFKSVLIDYTKMKEQEDRIKNALDKADKVHIVGEKTDLWINKKGRLACSCCGLRNIPDGEVFIAPIKNEVEGEVYFDLPNFMDGVDVVGAHIKFEKGKAVEISAEQGFDVLESNLNIDKGARYIGELGLGVNYGVKDIMRSTIFDEKIGGTIHIAMGKSYKDLEGGAPEGANDSAIHWDIVKDMRKKGSYIEIETNGRTKRIFQEGKYLI
ncbi:aminopeptidase [Patescibacteria group bacterium]|nr:aminopeptidase [Patescibacteria group bacterium]